MFDGTFEQSTILRTGPDGLTRVITRSSWDERESVLVKAGEAELFVFRRWEEFHEKALGFMPSWEAWACWGDCYFRACNCLSTSSAIPIATFTARVVVSVPASTASRPIGASRVAAADRISCLVSRAGRGRSAESGFTRYLLGSGSLAATPGISLMESNCVCGRALRRGWVLAPVPSEVHSRDRSGKLLN